MARGTIIIADDHPLFRDALRLAVESLNDAYDVEMAGEFDRVHELVATLEDTELILLDLKMPGNHGFAGLIRLRSEYPDLPIVIVSATEDATTVARALETGASGFIPKSSDADTIRAAIGAVLDGDIWMPQDYSAQSVDDSEFGEMVRRLQSLTPQQNRVLAMLAEGLLNKQIAYELSVSEATVKAHVSAVLMKLGVDSRTQAVILLNRLGIGAERDASSIALN